MAAAKSCHGKGNQARYERQKKRPASRSGEQARQMGVETDMSQIRTATGTKARLNARAAALAAAMMVAVLGGVFIYGIGFAGANVLHNAAHDARHANNFPCH
jgi:cobalt transporter subunit CbtB